MQTIKELTQQIQTVIYRACASSFVREARSACFVCVLAVSSLAQFPSFSYHSPHKRSLGRLQSDKYSDRKALCGEREKKLAAGHKPDDREEYTMEQTL